MSMFIDRKDETANLNEVFNSKKAELVLVYGRRRIGKSRLLVESIKGKNAIYFLADTSKNILDTLSNQIKDEFVRFSSWDDFFQFLYSSKYDVIVIDEFQYLYHVDKSWPTILQRWWEKLKETDKKIILCGSIISTIYKITKGYGSALYGRKTYEMKIEPLKFIFLKEFFKNYTPEDLVKVYCIIGGIPRYLEEFDSRISVNENIKKKILEKNSFLYNEPMNLLYEEFRDVTPYISILLAITQGYVRFNDMATYSRIEGHKLPKYLMVMERVGLIEKEIPVTDKKVKSKTTRYKLRDNFYKFWFRFVFKNKSMIEQGLIDDVFDSINNELNSYFGFCFEDICKELIIIKKPLQFTKIGKWWYKDKEIDLIALNEKNKEVLFTECKWQDRVNAEKIIMELTEKARYVDWNNRGRKESYAIFAKSFSKKINEFDGKKVYCFDLMDLK